VAARYLPVPGSFTVSESRSTFTHAPAIAEKLVHGHGRTQASLFSQRSHQTTSLRSQITGPYLVWTPGPCATASPFPRWPTGPYGDVNRREGPILPMVDVLERVSLPRSSIS
jgi:hypothetical protein